MSEYKLTFKKFFGHLHVVNNHRWHVFLLCCRVGIPIRGLLHDLSKYSPVEFIESAKYFSDGKCSPIKKRKEVVGFSMAWIHHKNHNKHHLEYWYDYNAEIPSPIMPFKYFLELVCDCFAAGITYQGKDWHRGYQLEYWNRVKDYMIIHPNMKKMITRVFELESEEGLKKVLKRKRLRELYDVYTKDLLQKRDKHVII